jgi:lysophospholipase L1-like esterase
VRYVALGDSYTIGTSVAEAERWPNQLAARLEDARTGKEVGVRPVDLVANLGVNGFTSGDVIAFELPVLEALAPELVSLLIGVNDVVQGVSVASYRGNVAAILDVLVALVGSGRALAITTPDYTVTPAGADYGDPEAQAAGIRTVNAVLSDEARRRDVVVVDIHDISLAAAMDRTLVARDGLHPSGTQYSLWVDRIAPVAATLAGRTR